MRSSLLALLSLVISSCASTKVAERRPVPPKGSDESSKPWNDPSLSPNAGGGMLGGLMEGR